MTASSHGRKRGRSPSSNCDECLPISKRINKLHIQPSQRQHSDEGHNINLNNSEIASGSTQNSPEAQYPWQQQHPSQMPNNINNVHPLQSGNYGNTNQQMNCPPFLSSPNGASSDPNYCNKQNIQTYAQQFDVHPEDLSGYKPEISATENPHYFRINNVLYDAHIERATRQGRYFSNNNSN